MQLDSVCAIYNTTVSYLASRYFNKFNHSKCENCRMCRVNSMFIPFSYIWTYFGLILIMGRLLWDIKEVQSLVILERITSLMTSHYVYILLLIGGLVLGGLLAMFIHRKEKDNQENINLLELKTQKIIN